MFRQKARPSGVGLSSTALAALLLVTGTARAHDFWIEPSTYTPAVPSSISVRLRVGEDFANGDPYSRNPAHIRSFELVGPSGTRLVSGRAGDEPAGVVRLETPGIHVIGYRSAQTVLELEAAKFESYLREEHLEAVSRQRAERGQTDAPGREAFSRCAKAIVIAGDADGDGYDRVLGFTLELIPERSPGALHAGDELPVRLLFEGKPLANAYVGAVNAEDTDVKAEARTDADGRARLRFARDGTWLVRSVHMIPAAGGLGADWESLWASLTFRIPAPR
jgi:uncharacterized GH25 family protein